MQRRRLVIIVLFALLTVLYPAFAWAAPEPENTLKTFDLQSLKDIQSPSGVYFDFSIGPGFLYFSKLKGNITPIPVESFQNFRGVNFGNIQKMSYNKTALYEAMMSARVFYWLQCGISFYGQSGISVETPSPAALAQNGASVWSLFRSDLQMYAVLFKAYLENPFVVPIGKWVMGSFLGFGVGPGWQSWVNNIIVATSIQNNTLSSSTISLNNKFSGNAVWTGDAGIYFQPNTNHPTMRIRIGCKYTAWGPMREIGRLKDQSVKVGPLQPLKARNVYSFAPYLGIKWCF